MVAPSTIRINEAKLMAEFPREKIFSGKTWVLKGTAPNNFTAKDVKKKIDKENKKEKFSKKSKIVKKTKGTYDVYGVYQEKF